MMWVDVKDLYALAFEVENDLCNIDAKDIGAYHLALTKLIEAVKEVAVNDE